MARQPAVQIGFFSFMTSNTKTHFKTFTLQAIHRFNGAMAFPTGNIFLDMPLMVEKNMFRQIKNLFPRCRGPGVKVPVLFLNFGMIGDDIFVAIQAFFHWGYPRVNRTVHIRMTKLTLDILDPRMDPMAEGDRLGRTDIGGRRDIEIKKKTDHKDNNQSHPENQLGIFDPFFGNYFFQ